MSATRKQAAAFFALVFTISWAFWIPAALVSAISPSLSLTLFPLGLFGPALAAITLMAFWRGRGGVRRLLGPVLGWHAGVRWYLIVVLGPAAIAWVATNLSTLLGTPTPGFGSRKRNPLSYIPREYQNRPGQYLVATGRRFELASQFL